MQIANKIASQVIQILHAFWLKYRQKSDSREQTSRGISAIHPLKPAAWPAILSLSLPRPSVEALTTLIGGLFVTRIHLMQLVLLGNYPPRQCGIATFTRHLAEGIQKAACRQGEHLSTGIIAINDQPGYVYPEEVIYQIRQQERKDYIQCAEYLNRSEAELVLLQHEFGIFGGESGSWILSFAERLKKPMVVTLHTVLRQPTDSQRLILQRLGSMAERLVVMSRMAVRMLRQLYRIPAHKVVCIEHGSPDYDYERREEARAQLGFCAPHTLLSFGLIGRGKGIETAIDALPKLKEVCPDFQYILLGKTHPHVLANEGEAYREELWARVEELGLSDNVRFDNAYVDEELLADYLLAADTYVLPYPNEAQITSGTLSYALGAGLAVVSTPFWHARELLGDGRGRLFPFRNSEALGEILAELYMQPEQQEALRAFAKTYGQGNTWANRGAEYLALIREVVEDHAPVRKLLRRPQSLVALDLQHIQRMSDDCGMLQHATYHLPNRKEGYCLDDNARALIVCIQALQQGGSKSQIETLLDRYLSFMHHVQRTDGLFHNFVGYDRNYLDKTGSEDSFGRAIWALGTLLASRDISQDHKDLAWQMYLSARPHMKSLRSLRAVAYCILGLKELGSSEWYSDHIPELCAELASFLIHEFEASSGENWNWFESVLSYGNAILPLAALEAGRLTQNPRLLEIAALSTQFLESHTFSEHMLHPIGCKRFMKKGESPSRYDQQPLDVMAMVWLYTAWYAHSADERDLTRASICYEWFMGRNDLGLAVFHAARGSCFDGLMERGINQNQGAESTLAFWLARNRLAEVLQFGQRRDYGEGTRFSIPSEVLAKDAFAELTQQSSAA